MLTAQLSNLSISSAAFLSLSGSPRAREAKPAWMLSAISGPISAAHGRLGAPRRSQLQLLLLGPLCCCAFLLAARSAVGCITLH